MAPLLSAFVLLVFATIVQGHFSFVRLKHGGEWKQPVQYIRNKTSPYDELVPIDGNFVFRYYNWPTYYVDRPESVRCGRGNMDHASQTEVLTVKAGDEIEVAQQRNEPKDWADDQFYGCPDDRGTCDTRDGYFQDFSHPGPMVVHLSKVPYGQDIRTYDGSGEWVKIHRVGLEDNSEQMRWILFQKSVPPKITFNIPAQTPPGQYLMRMDYIWAGFRHDSGKIGDPATYAQMYPTCAQLNVVSDSQAAFPKGVKIPEILAPNQPGMTTSVYMRGNVKLDANYSYPGGPLWDGENMLEEKPVLEWT